MSSSQELSVRNYPVHGDLIPDERIDRSRYSLRFATTPEELEAVQRLRFEVFNLELGEGLDESFATGRDEDRFDPVRHHLIVTDGEGNAVGIGRACVAKPHRNRDVLFLLWIGLALYMTRNRKRYLFGCCSLTSQDPVLGKRVMDHLEAQGHVHPTIRIAPQPDWRCYPEPFDPGPSTLTDAVKLPKLFSLYLRYGAKACGSPALDRTFKTIDYLVLFDRDDLDAGHRAIFFG